MKLSSAKILVLDQISADKLFLQHPSLEPWKTPAFTGVHLDV